MRNAITKELLPKRFPSFHLLYSSHTKEIKFHDTRATGSNYERDASSKRNRSRVDRAKRRERERGGQVQILEPRIHGEHSFSGADSTPNVYLALSEDRRSVNEADRLASCAHNPYKCSIGLILGPHFTFLSPSSSSSFFERKISSPLNRRLERKRISRATIRKIIKSVPAELEWEKVYAIISFYTGFIYRYWRK